MMLCILMEAYKRIHSPVSDLKQMNKAFRKWTNGYKAVEKFNAACKAELESLHATRSVGTTAVTCGILGIIVGIASAFYFIAAEHNFALALCISLPITALCLFALVYCTTPASPIPASSMQGRCGDWPKTARTSASSATAACSI